MWCTTRRKKGSNNDMQNIFMFCIGIVLVGAGCSQGSDSAPMTLGNGITFDVPEEWLWLDYPSDDSVRFETSRKPYTVVERIDVQGPLLRDVQGEMVLESTEFVDIYLEPCGGALACYNVVIPSGTYNVIWHSPTSNQDPPEDLDYVWTPDHMITKDVRLDVMKTFRSE